MSNSHTTRPFLKWPGGKYRLAETITQALPQGKRLIEPFSGSAAIFLNSDYKRYWINDLNQDLINLYQLLAKQTNTVLTACQALFHENNNQAQRYYQLREQFNQSEDILEKSALFLYLNRHSYNGLCRYNLKGGFNAPFGHYKKPYFPDLQIQHFIRKARQSKFTCASFEKVLCKTKPGDVVYCDPPYAPLSSTANFTQYSHKQFTQEQQVELAELAEDCANRGVPVVISNHNTAFTRKLYKEAKLVKFNVPRFISCKGNKRVPAKELLAIYSPQG